MSKIAFLSRRTSLLTPCTRCRDSTTTAGKAPAPLSSPSLITGEAKRQFEVAYVIANWREHGGNITRTAAAIESTARACRRSCGNWGFRGSN